MDVSVGLVNDEFVFSADPRPVGTAAAESAPFEAVDQKSA
jgi:hypothetical protein